MSAGNHMDGESNYLDGWLQRRILRQVEDMLPGLVEKEVQRRAQEAGQLIAEGVCICQTCGSMLYEHRHGPKRAPRIADIIRLVSQEYGIRPDIIQGRNQTRAVTLARQAVMWLASDIGLGWAAIGRVLDRDHTSVMHGARAVEDRLRSGGDEAARILHLRSLLRPAVEVAA